MRRRSVVVLGQVDQVAQAGARAGFARPGRHDDRGAADLRPVDGNAEGRGDHGQPGHPSEAGSGRGHRIGRRPPQREGGEDGHVDAQDPPRRGPHPGEEWMWEVVQHDPGDVIRKEAAAGCDGRDLGPTRGESMDQTPGAHRCQSGQGEGRPVEVTGPRRRAMDVSRPGDQQQRTHRDRDTGSAVGLRGEAAR